MDEQRLRPHVMSVAPHSAIPRVVGILAIVFSGFGLIGSLVTAFLDEEMAKLGVTRDQLGNFGTWMHVYLLPAAAVFGIHLAAGILSVKYARWAPRMITAYAVLALALLVVDLVITTATFPGGTGSAMFDELAGPRLGLAFLSGPWPIVALVLMNLKSARQACAARPR